MSRILIIKLANNSFERYFSKQMEKSEIDVCDIAGLLDLSKTNSLRDILLHRGVYRYAKSHNFDKYDKIIVFDAVVLVPGIFLAVRGKAKIYLWLWNSLGSGRNIGLRFIKGLFPRVDFYTFDRADACRYGFKYNHQFYFRLPNVGNPSLSSKTLFFIGQDKGRLNQLQVIASLVPEGFDCDFRVVPDPEVVYPMGTPFLTAGFMDYSEVIDIVGKSEVLVDLVKHDQVGMTLRVLEALYYGKKIITNNASLLSSEIYTTGNVFVLGCENEGLAEFLDKPTYAYPSELLDRYSYESWLEGFN